MAPHSSTLVWKIPWTEEPGGLQSMGSLRVGHDWVTSLSLFTFMHWRRKWQPTPVFLPGESQGWGSLVGCHGLWAAQSWTQLKRLSSSSSSICLLQYNFQWSHTPKLTYWNTYYYKLLFICITFRALCVHMEKEMATHSSVLAWRIPGTGEPGGLPSTGSHRVGHDWSDLVVVAVYI